MTGAHAEFEASVDFAGGMVNVVRGFAYPDHDAQGRVVGCFLLLLDITRERAFEALLQAARATKRSRPPAPIAIPRRREP